MLQKAQRYPFLLLAIEGSCSTISGSGPASRGPNEVSASRDDKIANERPKTPCQSDALPEAIVRRLGIFICFVLTKYRIQQTAQGMDFNYRKPSTPF